VPEVSQCLFGVASEGGPPFNTLLTSYIDLLGLTFSTVSSLKYETLKLLKTAV